MEFELGSLCQFKNCQVKDYLPVQCPHCKLMFCKDHYFPDNHGCNFDITKVNQTPKCPICNELIHIKQDMNINYIMNLYIQSNCSKYLLKDWKAQLKKDKERYKTCSLSTCFNKEEYDTITCSLCYQKFCLQHRHPDDHSCIKIKKKKKKKKYIYC